MPDPRPREQRNAQQEREELAGEYAVLSSMKPHDEVVERLIGELRVKLARKIAEVGVAVSVP